MISSLFSSVTVAAGFIYVGVAAVILLLSTLFLAMEVFARATGGYGDLTEEELSLAKRGLLLFWAWPIIAAPYLIEIYSEKEDR